MFLKLIFFKFKAQESYMVLLVATSAELEAFEEWKRITGELTFIDSS